MVELFPQTADDPWGTGQNNPPPARVLRWRQENELHRAQHLDEDRCPVIADDGEQCWRYVHDSDPDAHDFAGLSANPVDGGQPFQTWIRAVHGVRGILLNQVREDGRTLFGTFGGQRALVRQLAAIAEAVGLTVVLEGDLPQEIREPEDDTPRGPVVNAVAERIVEGPSVR